MTPVDVSQALSKIQRSGQRPTCVVLLRFICGGRASAVRPARQHGTAEGIPPVAGNLPRSFRCSSSIQVGHSRRQGLAGIPSRGTSAQDISSHAHSPAEPLERI